MARALVCVQDRVHLFRVVGGRLDHLTAFKAQAEVFKLETLIQARRVEANLPLDAVLDWCGENFAVWDVAIARAGDGWQTLDGKAQLCPRPHHADAVGPFHERLERKHCPVHLFVIERADIEIEVLKVARAHPGKLRHCLVRIAQHAPLFAQPHILHLAGKDGTIQLALALGDACALHRVVIAAEGDVRVHLFHARAFPLGAILHLFAVCAQKPLTLRLGIIYGKIRAHPRAVGGLEHLLRQDLLTVEDLDQHLFTLLHHAGIADQVVCQFS